MKTNCKLLLFLSVLFAVSCVEEQPQEQVKKSFLAQIEEFTSAVKTSLGERNSIVWAYGDQISIFEGSSRANLYAVYDYCVGSPNGDFYLESSYNAGFSSGNELHTNVAVYPYSSEHACYGPGLTDDGNSYMVSGVYFSNWQSYSYNSFPEDSFVMMAVTDGKDDRNLKFKNVCGALKLSLRGSGSIQSLTLHGNLNEQIAGHAQIYGEFNGVPTHEFVVYDHDYSSITLECGQGVTLNESEPTVFIMTVPPVYFESGFSVIVEDIQGNTEVLNTDIPHEIQRSSILVMPEVEVSLAGAPTVTIAEALNTNDVVTISGVVKATSSTGLILSDETANIYVYYGNSFQENYEIGEILSIRGYIDIYKHAYNFYPDVTTSHGYTYVEYEEATIIDEEYIERQQYIEFSQNMLNCEYVEFEGYLLQNNTYFRLDNSNQIVTLGYLNREFNNLLSGMQYCKLRVRGYSYILSSSTYPSIIASSIEIIGNEEREIDVALGEYKTVFTGTVTATSTRGYVLDNEDECWFVYCTGNYQQTYCIGDIVTTTSMFKTFNYGTEIFRVMDEYIGVNENITLPEPEILTAEALDNYMGETAGKKPYKDSVIPTKYIKATGTLSVTGATSVLVYIDGAMNNISLFSPDTMTMDKAYALDGQKVDLTGYTFKSGGGNSISVVTSTLELSQSE